MFDVGHNQCAYPVMCENVCLVMMLLLPSSVFMPFLFILADNLQKLFRDDVV